MPITTETARLRAGRRTLAGAALVTAALAASALSAPAALAADAPPTSVTPSLTSFTEWTQSVSAADYDYELTTFNSAPALRFSNAKGTYGIINQLSTPVIVEVGERTVTAAAHRLFIADFTIDAADYDAQPGLGIEVAVDKDGNRSGGNVVFRHDADEKLTLTTYWADAGSEAELADWNNDTEIVDFTGPLDIRVVTEYIANGPDSIRVFVDGVLAVQGQGFEAYHAAVPSPAQTSDSLLFRINARTPVPDGAWDTAEPTAPQKDDLLGNGFYFSGISLAASDQISPSVTVSGTPVMGGVLTASAKADVVNPTFAYQWLRDGVSIPGATGATYTVKANDVGKRLSVKVTASKTAFTKAVVTSAKTAPVTAATLTFSTPAAITGTLKLGHTLTAQGATTPGATYTYQWYRNGAAIKNATAKTYKLSASDVGRLMTVRVIAKKAGYTSLSDTSDPTTAVQPGTLKVGTPTISGTFKVGGNLNARSGTWTSGATIKYAFYADGDLIQFSPSRTLRLTWEEKGKDISVIVIGSKPGYATAESAETSPRGPVR